MGIIEHLLPPIQKRIKEGKNNKINMAGFTSGRLTVISAAENDRHGNAYWNCRCECGNTVKVKGQSLRNGHTKSCGCLGKENRRKANILSNTKHGLKKTKEY